MSEIILSNGCSSWKQKHGGFNLLQGSQDQMVELLQKFGSEVKKVEELRCRVERTESTPNRGKTVAVKGEDGIPFQEIVHTPHKTESTITMTAVATQSEMKISKPPQICIFSGQEPVPKDEGNYDQWEFQVRGAIATHTENSVRAAIVNSLRGLARDLVGFVNFDADLERILMEVTNRFSKRYTGDQLQQEFYKLNQEKGEKIGTFAGRLELIYRQPHDRLSERFDEQHLKDCLFYGVSQSLCDSSRYLYKDPTVMYQVLLQAIKETASKYGEGRATARPKSATVADETGIAELKDKIEALTTIVKSSNVLSAGTKPPGSPKPKHGNFHKFQWKDGMIMSAARPFKEGQKPIQCYNCGR